MGAPPALAFTEVDAPDLTAFHLDTGGMGCFCKGIQAPLG
jgi:hypothetical protein